MKVTSSYPRIPCVNNKTLESLKRETIKSLLDTSLQNIFVHEYFFTDSIIHETYDMVMCLAFLKILSR